MVHNLVCKIMLTRGLKDQLGPNTELSPFGDMDTDFTKVNPSRGYKYLLVFVCTFSVCIEAFPTRPGKAREVTKALLRDIIPRFRMLLTIGSDNRLASVAKTVQQVAKILQIRWKLHSAYRPQSSGKAEHMKHWKLVSQHRLKLEESAAG